MPRVIIASLLFNHADHFRPAVESILRQTFRDFALLLVDDASTDSTGETARTYAARDPRVSYHRNETRLGMTRNSRKAFSLARARHPDAEYFAWTSDHDLWEPEWLERLVGALDADPNVVVAYPRNRRIGRSGELLKRKPWVFDTAGIRSRRTRMRRAILHMRAGNMVYGLYRVGALHRAGVYRDVLVPDRLLFAELALYGQFAQVRQVLWFRRWYGREFSLRRQSASFFPEGRPLYTYLPWWIGHAASLFRTYTLRGEGRPDVTRAGGAAVALEYALIAGPLHGWQMMREMRGRLIEQSARLQRRARRVRRSMSRLAFEAARRPYLAMVQWAHGVPAVRAHVVRPLLKPELDGIPAASAVQAVHDELERLRKTDGPIFLGPWVGEVGYELLYWIPFLNWALSTHGIDRRRLIAVSRGGARPWYRHLTTEYVDVFSLFSLEEYRQANEARWDKAGHQKQYRAEQMDLDILQRARERMGLPHGELLHPSLMYRLLRFFWFDKAGIGLLKRHTDYRPFLPTEQGAISGRLPEKYVAVRFYFRPSFPDTPENRRFAAEVVSSISREIPVVLLNTGHKPDEHEDLAVTGSSVYRVDDLMNLEQNLEVQTEIVSRACAFVGTYGGLAYLGPFYGVPSISFYSDEAELVPSHLDASWRLGQTFGVRSVVLHTRLVPLLRVLLRATADVNSAVGS
jgi:glycosyltransferase involved in cell wall biosynthesis